MRISAQNLNQKPVQRDNSLKKVILIFALCCLKFSSVYTQEFDHHYLKNDSIMIHTALKYLSNKTGSGFVEKHMVVNTVDSIQGMVTFLIKQQSLKSKRNLIIVFVDGNTIDSTETPKINKIDIRKYYTGAISKNIFLDKSYVIELAEKTGFQKGIKDWSIKLTRWRGKILWEIENTQKEQLQGYYFATGNGLSINAQSGKYKKFDWTSGE